MIIFEHDQNINVLNKSIDYNYLNIIKSNSRNCWVSFPLIMQSNWSMLSKNIAAVNSVGFLKISLLLTLLIPMN